MWKKVIQLLFVLFLLICFSLGAYLYSSTDMKTLFYRMGHIENMRNKEGLENEEEHNTEKDEKDNKDNKEVEGLETQTSPSNVQTQVVETPNCPNLLLKRGMSYYLYTSDPSNNQPIGEPIVFQNLEEYKKHLDNEKAQGRNCPVLFVQQENNAQGQDVYVSRETPFLAQQQPGLPSQMAHVAYAGETTPQMLKYQDATRANPPYNEGNYTGFDPYGLYVGRITEIDQLAGQGEQQEISDNPMDPNWGGIFFTQKALEQGKYKGNEVTRTRYYTPKSQFIPILNSGMPKPPDPMDIF